METDLFADLVLALDESFKQCLQPMDGLGFGWVFLKILVFGWVWVFAAPVWVRFRFLFFKKPGFRLSFGFFQN
jgi:hypothetical protein